MVDVHDHAERYGETRARKPPVERAARGNRLAELTANRHRLPEDVFEPCRLALFGHVLPAVDHGFDQFLPARLVVVVLLREHRELRAHAVCAQFTGYIGQRAEPFEIIGAHIGVGMTEMIEATVRARHDGRYPHAGSVQRAAEGANTARNDGGRP